MLVNAAFVMRFVDLRLSINTVSCVSPSSNRENKAGESEDAVASPAACEFEVTLEILAFKVECPVKRPNCDSLRWLRARPRQQESWLVAGVTEKRKVL